MHQRHGTRQSAATTPLLNAKPRVQEENEAEEEVLDGVASVLAVALRRWGDNAMPFVEALMPAIGQARPAHQHVSVSEPVCRLASGCAPYPANPVADMPRPEAAVP